MSLSRWKVWRTSPCSVSCGLGIAQRTVSCVQFVNGTESAVAERNCHSVVKPATTVPCLVQVCTFRWEVKPWSQVQPARTRDSGISRCFHSTNSPGRTRTAFLTGHLYIFLSCWLCFEKPSSAQFPADLGSSPEWCPAWVPRSRSRSAPCCACTCPSPSPSRAAAWEAVETTGPSSPRPEQFLQVQRRPAPSFGTSRALLQPPVSPVSSTHSWEPHRDLLSRLIRLIPVLCFSRRVWTASLGAIRHCGPERRKGTLHRVHWSATGRGHFHQSRIWLLELQTAK